MKRNIDLGLFILRITFGALMLCHGISKLIHGLEMIKGMLAAQHIPTFIAYGVLIGEVIAPLLIIAGFRTRIAASIYAFNLIIAIILVHSGDLFGMNSMGGYALELQMLYLFGAVTLFFTGGGKLAVSSTSQWD